MKSSSPLNPPTRQVRRSDTVFLWLTRGVSTAGALVTAWAAITTGPMLVHGHPAYAILLALTFAVSAVLGVRAWRTRVAARRRFTVLHAALMGLSLLIVAVCAWLVPSSASAPALAAMQSDATVTVHETATGITLTPTGAASDVGVFFQPGARVDARAYAAVLRPLAEDGHRVIIAKQPLGIAFLSTGAFSSVRDSNPDVANWVVGGHSLGGTVAAMDAEAFSTAKRKPVVGLLLYASYPASDMSDLEERVLSLSASLDGLATPEKIQASKTDLPPDATFVVVDGAVHSFFGDYGPQAGDGVPSISHDAARQIIVDESRSFVESLNR